MQEMSQQICINSYEEETKQLRDTRDGKTYWVAKLKDGNCWMTQNLDYDGGGTSTTIPNWPKSGGAFQGYNDPGSHVYNVGSNGQNGNCTNANFASCSTQFSAIDPSNTSTANQEKMHYHIGNYYSWNAATNGTGGTITSGEAPDSVCPEGWKLPTGGSNTSKGSLTYLLTQYGVQSNITSTGIDGKAYQIYDSPLYFIYGGNLYSGQLNFAGSQGYYWSSTPGSDADYAHYLNFYNIVSPSSLSFRYLGMSVRCVAEGGSFPEYTDTGNANISVTVSPVISIDATSSMEGEVDFTTIARGDISATISSNQNYKVLLGTSQSTLEQDPKLTNHNIPMVENDQSIVAGIGKWGVRKLTNSSDIKKESITDEYDRTITQVTVNTADTNITDTTATGTTISTSANYSPIGLFAIDSDNTIKDNSILFYDAGESGISKVIFPVAIAVDAKLPGGKYFTEVVITAVAN